MLHSEASSCKSSFAKFVEAPFDDLVILLLNLASRFHIHESRAGFRLFLRSFLFLLYNVFLLGTSRQIRQSLTQLGNFCLDLLTVRIQLDHEIGGEIEMCVSHGLLAQCVQNRPPIINCLKSLHVLLGETFTQNSFVLRGLLSTG